MPKQRKKPAGQAAGLTMTAADAVIATLIGHGLDTIYALPGVQNDFLFEALFGAQDRLRTVHTRHEQGAAYMALGAALATGKPSAFAVVPGPGLLNAGAALLTAYGMNAPVLGLIGQIPDADIGRGLGQLHEIRDQGGIIKRLVDHSTLIRKPEQASRATALAMRAMQSRRPGPAVLECAIDVWGKSGPVTLQAPLQVPATKIDHGAIRKAAKLLGAAKRPLIICGGGAQGVSKEVTALSAMLQAPVLGFRRGRGVLDARDPLSVTLPLGRDLWGEADVVLAVGTRLLIKLRQWGIDRETPRSSASMPMPKNTAACTKPAVALTGDATPILQALLAALPAHNAKRASRRAEMQERQAAWHKRLEKIALQIAFLEAIRAMPEDGIFVDEVTQMGFAARIAFPVYKPRTFLSPGYQDPLGWGFATALGAQHAGPMCRWSHLRRRRLHVYRHRNGNRDTAPHPARHHRVQRWRVRQRPASAGALRQPPDRQRSGQSGFCRLWQEFWRRGGPRKGSGRVAPGVAARLRAPRRTDADRGAGGRLSEPVGIHQHAQGPRVIAQQALPSC